MEHVILWLIFCMLACLVACKKASVIAKFFVDEYYKSEEQMMRLEYKQCPYCAEPIKKEAISCRYCRNELITNMSEPQKILPHLNEQKKILPP